MSDALSVFYRQLRSLPAGADPAAIPVPESVRAQAEELTAFLRFHAQAKQRLSGKMAEFNREIRTEDEPHLHENLSEFARVNEGGKYIRGALVNLGYSLYKAESVHYSDDLALAFELFQTGILIHDDIIDHAALRRGMPTIPRAYLSRWKTDGQAALDQANAMAICAGDIGMYFANQRIAVAYAHDERLSRVLQYFNRVVIDTIRGEIIDVMLPYEEQHFPNPETNLTASIYDILRLKTAQYTVTGPLCLGALLAGAGEEDIRGLERFAEDLGVAFQIMDDILSIFAEDAALGKAGASDIAEFKQTLLYAHVRAKGGEALQELLRYYGKSDLNTEDVRTVRRIFTESGSLDYARQEMNARFENALQTLQTLPLAEEKKKPLYGLVHYLKLREA